MVDTIVHIGADKTGTTAIQRAMAGHRDELLARRVWYPDLDGRPDHRLLATEPERALLTRSVPDGVDTVLLSAEALWAIEEPAIAGFLAGLPPGNVTVVAYLRDPVDHAEAAFTQRLRLSRSEVELRALFAARRIPAPLNPIVGRAARRLTQLEHWVQAVDRHRATRPDPSSGIRLLVLPYDPDGDVVVGLCRAVGLDALIPLLADRTDPRPNAAVDLVTLHASVLVRAAAGPAAQTRFLDAVAARPSTDVAPSVGGGGSLLPAPLRRRIERRTEPILDRIERAVGRLERPAGPARPPAPTGSPGLDGGRARSRLEQVWPTFPDGEPATSD